MLCVVATIRSHVEHLQQNGASGHTPLVVVHQKNKCDIISIKDITKTLQKAVEISGAQVNFKLEDVSAKFIRAGVAMAILIARVDTDKIKLVGSWRSDIMLRYLRTSAQIFTSGLVMLMVHNRDYVLIPPIHGD